MRTCPSCGEVFPINTPGTCPKDGAQLLLSSDYAASRSDALLGTTLAERYEIIGRVGTGGMGTVYRARQVGLARDVALKVLRPEGSADRETVARFEREAKAMSLLLHANTVRVFEFGEDPSGYLYLSMELLEGESLTACLDREGALDVRKAIEITQQILRSLAEAHGKGLIHRDLKPDNIMLARIAGQAQPVTKVLDFGIAKVFKDDAPQLDQLETQAGTVFGTPRYMSPEQAQGKPLDQRSDLYAVGVLLYQMLVGRPPFVDMEAVVVMSKHIRETPKPLRDAAPQRPIPPSLERVVLRALAKSASARPANAEEFDQALTACLAEVERERALAANGQRSADVVFIAGRPVSKRTAKVGAGALLASMLAASIAIVAGSSSREADNRVPLASQVPSTHASTEPAHVALSVSIPTAVAAPVAAAIAPTPSGSLAADPTPATPARAHARTRRRPARRRTYERFY
jgi:serine/threonine-protein kinase